MEYLNQRRVNTNRNKILSNNNKGYLWEVSFLDISKYNEKHGSLISTLYAFFLHVIIVITYIIRRFQSRICKWALRCCLLQRKVEGRYQGVGLNWCLFCIYKWKIFNCHDEFVVLQGILKCNNLVVPIIVTKWFLKCRNLASLWRLEDIMKAVIILTHLIFLIWSKFSLRLTIIYLSVNWIWAWTVCHCLSCFEEWLDLFLKYFQPVSMIKFYEVTFI